MKTFGCVLGVFYAIGFGLLGYTLWNAWRSTQAKGWPVAPGKITQLSLEEKSGDRTTTFEVKVEYTYSVAGVTYEGNTLAYGYAGSSDEREHDEIYQRLNEAHSVSVRYNPAAPADCCLSFGVHRSILRIVYFTMVWLFVITLLSLFGWLSGQSDRVLIDNLSVQ